MSERKELPPPAPPRKQGGESQAASERAAEPHWVLGINTASETLGVALARGIDLQAELFVVPAGPRGHHAERLMVAVDALCRLSDRTPGDLAALAVAVGPGGFTGVRTALAAAKAIAQSLDKPLIGVTSLEALAEQLPGHGLVSPLVDARRGDVFAGLYCKDAMGLSCLIEPGLLSLTAWLDQLAALGHHEVVFVGDGALQHRDVLAQRTSSRGLDPSMHLLRAGSVARLGAIRYAQGRFGSPEEVVPEYLRAPSAVPNWQAMCPPAPAEGLHD